MCWIFTFYPVLCPSVKYILNVMYLPVYFCWASYARFHSFSSSFLLFSLLVISLSLCSLLCSMSMLSIGNYIIRLYPMKYSFSDTNSVLVCLCLCLCAVDDGEAVCVFNKHNTATPHTLTALASNFTATHTRINKHTGICQD